MKIKALVLTLAALSLAFAIRADDTAQTAKVDKGERVVVKVNKEQIKQDAQDSGNKISHFFVHTVGGKIGRGLKSGTEKISDAFK